MRLLRVLVIAFALLSALLMFCMRMSLLSLFRFALLSFAVLGELSERSVHCELPLHKQRGESISQFVWRLYDAWETPVELEKLEFHSFEHFNDSNAALTQIDAQLLLHPVSAYLHELRGRYAANLDRHL